MSAKPFHSRPILQWRVRQMNRLGRQLTRRGMSLQRRAHALVDEAVDAYRGGRGGDA